LHWLLLRQLRNRQFHGATDRDAHNAFVLIDPGVSSQRLLCLFAQRFQIFQALPCPRLFVVTFTRRRSNDCQHDDAEQYEKKNNPNPRGKRSGRMRNPAK
jgi:hypothetical protein